MLPEFVSRLLNVAVALRESPDPEEYTGAMYMTSGGVPTDPLGHYAYRTDLQDTFKIGFDKATSKPWPVFTSTGKLAYYDSEQTVEHFGLTDEECEIIFGYEGCGGAITPEDAAEFIERFVAERCS